MTLSIPLQDFRVQQRRDLALGTLFHPVDANGVGALHVVAGTREAKCRIALGGSQPFTLRGMIGVDGANPGLPVAVESLRICVGARAKDHDRQSEPGDIYLSDEGAFLLVVQLGVGGQTSHYWVSLNDWTASGQRPENYALVTNWQLIADTRDGPVVVVQVGLD